MSSGDKKPLPALIGALVLLAGTGYLAWQYFLEVDAADEIESRFEKRFETVPVPYFELTGLVRPGKDLLSHDFGSWSFAGIRRSYPPPVDELFPDGSCIWIACERDGTNCLNLYDCGTGSCADFEKEARAFNPEVCDPASKHGARAGWERLRKGH